ncbi:V-type ATP synthase subunit A [Candidatus Woesearchaeota archaeon]|nr:V-type ATP synthase subunit A [Candidatus Woesearchaeota archaeon]
MKKGVVYRVAGPVAIAELDARMYDVVHVGDERLLGEVIQINGSRCTIQIYEDTTGLKPGAPVVNTGEPLSVELGPGMLSSIYDGIQRPLPELKKLMGDFILRGAAAPGLDRSRKWDFKPVVKKGDKVSSGSVIGEVNEGQVVHRVMVPPGNEGVVKEVRHGSFRVDEVVCVLDNGFELSLMHKWPVRKPRPTSSKLAPVEPLVTGLRVIDALFPIAKGGVAAIPGPFGSGKTITQQSLAKWCDADIIVYVGCGERGNEMTEVLTEFPELIDPRSGKPLLNRMVLIANTSNMPVAAREASIYCGMTMAEYYRDMGYNVAMMADSTSRWAEAMREISSRLEELPGEEGYPAYLSARLAEFYERSGRYVNINGSQGSVSVIGAVSPAGGDFSEPVTQGTLRVVKVFWALDAKLAQRRHFPAINWLNSYSLYLDALSSWFAANVVAGWREAVDSVMRILQEEEKLLEIVQLVGSDALPEREQVTIQVARLVREVVLQQNAFHEVDTYSEPKKTYAMIKAILRYGDLSYDALKSGVRVSDIISVRAKDRLAEVKFVRDYDGLLKGILGDIEAEFGKLGKRQEK